MADKTPEMPKLLTPRQVADLTGYSVGTIYNMCSNGELQFVKLRKGKKARSRFHEDYIREWIASFAPRDPVKTRNYNRKKKAA